MAAQNYRLIDIDALDPENQFPASLLTPEFPPVPTQTIIEIQNGLRQLLQRGDKAGALRAALENAPYGGDDRGKIIHLQTILEILSSIKSTEMNTILAEIYESAGGVELVDVLMKYIYKGMAVGAGVGGKLDAGAGANMSVLLSWHEKLVGVAGEGSVVRVMTDRRTV